MPVLPTQARDEPMIDDKPELVKIPLVATPMMRWIIGQGDKPDQDDPDPGPEAGIVPGELLTLRTSPVVDAFWLKLSIAEDGTGCVLVEHGGPDQVSVQLCLARDVTADDVRWLLRRFAFVAESPPEAA